MPSSSLDLPFDQYQRYGALAIAAAAVRAQTRRPLRILDIGDWNGLAATFCPEDSCFCLDPDGHGPAGAYVRADGAALPFGDQAFDIVACLDAIEHVPRSVRSRVFDEARRVAGLVVVVAAPVADWGASDAEARLATFVRDYLGGEQMQLREHAAHGLPLARELRDGLGGDGWILRDTPSGLLADWLPMMLAKHSLIGARADAAHRALDRRYNERHGAIDPARPAYRHIVFAVRADGEWLANAIANRLRLPRESGDAEDTRVAYEAILYALRARAGATGAVENAIDVTTGRSIAELAHRIDALRAQRDALLDELTEARTRVAAFESGRFIRLMAWLDRARRGWTR